MKNIVTIEDAALEQVTGGLSFSLDITKAGIGASGPLGTVSFPNPFTVATDLLSGAVKGIGDLLGKLGGTLTKIGGLFDFN